MTGAPVLSMRKACTMAAVALSVGLASCTSEDPEVNAAAKAVELARYLPGDSQLVQTVDVIEARKELDLPEDANAAPTGKGGLRPDGPETKLFGVTARVFPFITEAMATNFNARGASPLDGTLIRAAASSGNVTIVSTAEPFEDIAAKLELSDYKLKGDVYLAGPKTVSGASPTVADGDSGRVVFAHNEKAAKHVLHRMDEGAEPGLAAEALQPADGSVRLATVNPKRSSCVTAFGVSQGAGGGAAVLALTISGEKPEPEFFDPKPLKGVDTGTPTVLVDALIVPFSITKPLRDGIQPITQVISVSKAFEVENRKHLSRFPKLTLPPFKTYDCP